MKIVVDRTACAGHARCAATAPDLFPLGEDGYLALEELEVKAGDEPRARRAALACPERAIRIEDG